MIFFELPGCETEIRRRTQELENAHFSRRLWNKDATLWGATEPKAKSEIEDRLGWLSLPETMLEKVDLLRAFAAEIKAAGFEHVVHMGMGGSSLAALVLARSFAPTRSGLPLTVIDTTDPATIRKIEDSIPLSKTLFIVATKSGTTAEALAFLDYFYKTLGSQGMDKPGQNFIAITDPGTLLVKMAEERSFRKVFINQADVGGRYSSLSYFGLVPASLLGMDLERLLSRAQAMSDLCQKSGSPGLSLGATLGESVLRGGDKLTLFVEEPLQSLGLWIEQLVAESTGKGGKGIIPVVDEPLGSPEVYENDRVFVHIRSPQSTEGLLKTEIGRLQQAGFPIVTIELSDPLDLGADFFLWEVATAVAGSILAVNPFDQPNVSESKENTERLLGEVRQQGQLSQEPESFREGDLSYYGAHGSSGSEIMARFLRQARGGDYIALLAYLAEVPDTHALLQSIRLKLRDALHLATTLGYGPRFLHSTGQLHKGGPNTGLFLQLTADDEKDVDLPGQPLTFGLLKRAQARGDWQALQRHGRRCLGIHLGAHPREGLASLQNVIFEALKSF